MSLFDDAEKTPEKPMTVETIASPCVKTCAVDGASGLCIGCLRTLNEIASWSTLTAEARARIMPELPNRRSNLREQIRPPFTG